MPEHQFSSHSMNPMNYDPKMPTGTDEKSAFSEILWGILEMFLELVGYTRDAIRAIKKDLLEAPHPSHPSFY